MQVELNLIVLCCILFTITIRKYAHSSHFLRLHFLVSGSNERVLSYFYTKIRRIIINHITNVYMVNKKQSASSLHITITDIRLLPVARPRTAIRGLTLMKT